MTLKYKSLFIVGLLLSMCAEAHGKTRVYVYNNTLSKLDFTLRQTNTILAPQYWEQGADSISATKAEEILSIKKSGGVKNNKTYDFEFDVSDGTDTVVLKIRIKGKAVGRETLQSAENKAFTNDKTLRSVRVGDRNIYYRKEGKGNFMFVISDLSKKLFRFPVEDRSLIDEGTSPAHPLKGPLTPDMRTGDRKRGLGYNCLAFDGNKNPPHCYSGHKGTDYMLKDGFKQMDRPGNYVVAAREGTVVKVVQNLYDRCKAKPKSKDTGQFLQPDCNGNNDPDEDGYLDGNTIIVDHGDGVYTEYYHLMKNSSLVWVGKDVECGEPLARIGSSGHSTSPHLHFEVHMCKKGKSCDSHSSGNLVTVNPYNGIYTGRGYWNIQGSGRLPSSACAPGQSVWQGETTPAARGCKSDNECAPGSFCNKRIGQENRCLIDGTLDVGDACYKNKECGSGKCQGSGDARVCVCSDDGDCNAGQFCNKRLQMNRCLADGTSKIGEACDKNKECATGQCQGNGDNRMCVCADDSDCIGGICIKGPVGVGQNYCRNTATTQCPSGWSYETRNPLNKDRCNRTVTETKPLKCKLGALDNAKNWTGPHAQSGADECRSLKGKNPKGVECPRGFNHNIRSGTDTCTKTVTEHQTPTCPPGWDYKSQNGRDVCQDSD